MNRKLMSLLTLLSMSCLTVVFSLTLPGCNTLEGAGEDVEAAGEGVQDAAN